MHRRARSFIVVTVILSLAAVWAGCGGGDSTGAELSKAQFVKKAGQICEHAETEQLRLATSYLKAHPGTEEEELILPAGLPPIEEQLEKLKALPAPEGDEATLEAYFDAVEKGIQATEAEPRNAMKTSAGPFTEANSIAAKYKLTGCESLP